MCLSIWPTYRRSFRRGWWLVTHCIILSALGHDNEAGVCVWSVSATVVDISEKWTQLHDWEADGSQVLRNFKQNLLLHELKTKDAQLCVTSTQLPEVRVSLQLTKTQTCWLQQMIWTTADFILLQRWKRVVLLLECHPAWIDNHRRFRKNYRSHIQTSSSPRRTAWFLMMGLTGCSETSVTIILRCLTSHTREDLELNNIRSPLTVFCQ